MLRVLTALILVFGVVPVYAAEDKMLFVEFRVVAPNIPPESFDGLPRKIWRLGTKYLRLDDQRDPKTKVHGLIIVNEPDIWVVDRNTNRAQHSEDPGPHYAIHYTVLPSEESEKLKQLEIGQELRFFQENDAKEMPPQTVDGVTCRVLRLEIDDRIVTLFLKGSNVPVQVAIQAANYGYAVRYLKYDPDQKPDMDLFKLPPGVEIIRDKH